MRDLNEGILEAINKYKDCIGFVYNGLEKTYQQLYIDSSKIYKHMRKGKTLIKCQNKYYFLASFVAALFHHNMPFLSNFESHVYDDYQFADVVDDNFVENALADEEYNLYQYEEFDNNIPAMVVLSSGTTKEPKPVVISHKAIVNNIRAIMKISNSKINWTYLSILPLDHAMGIRGDFIDAILYGGKIVYTNSLMDFFLNIKKYNPERLTLSVSLLNNLKEILKSEGKANFCPNLLYITVGGSKIHEEDYNYYRDNFGIYLVNGYGLTECTPTISLNTPKFHMFGSEGYILDCHKIRISDEGEIIVSGDSLMLNYLDLYEKGILCDEIHTKDCGYIKDNFLFIIGRIDNLIVLDNGYKIQPEKLEEEIMTKYQVKDCVLYYKNKQLYLDIVADVDKLNQIKKEYEKLYIEYHLVDHIEKNRLGKINRAYYKG